MSDAKTIDRRIAAAIARVRGAFRARIKLVTAGAGAQLVQLDGVASEGLDAVELMQQYGVTSSPPAATMALVVPVGGRTAHSVVIATEHGEFRLRVAPGEVAVYDDLGQSVHLTRAGIVMRGAGLPVTITGTPEIICDTPLLTATGEIHAAGRIVTDADLVAAGNALVAGDIVDQSGEGGRAGGSVRELREAHNEHSHTEQGDGNKVSLPDRIVS